jgi:hypothetical protein
MQGSRTLRWRNFLLYSLPSKCLDWTLKVRSSVDPRQEIVKREAIASSRLFFCNRFSSPGLWKFYVSTFIWIVLSLVERKKKKLKLKKSRNRKKKSPDMIFSEHYTFNVRWFFKHENNFLLFSSSASMKKKSDEPNK